MKKIIILTTISSIFIISCFSNDGYIDLVKHGSFASYQDVTVGEMADSVFDNVTWESIVADDDRDYVNMYGYLGGNELHFQFRIGKDEESWVVNYVGLNGESQNINGSITEFYKAYLDSLGSEGYINLVKSGHFESYYGYFKENQEVTVGEMLDSIFDNMTWEYIDAPPDEWWSSDYVKMNGYLEGKKVFFKFIIGEDKQSWVLDNIIIDGEICNIPQTIKDLYQLYLKNT